MREGVVSGLRRCVTVPALPVLLAVSAGLLAVVTAVTGPVSLAWTLTRRGGRWRPVRACAFLTLYLGADLVALALGTAVRLRGRGRPDGRAAREAGAYGVLDGVLRVLRRGGERLFGLRLEIDAPADDVAGGSQPVGGLLVFARHAGPGDSFLLVEQAMTRYGLRPRVVLKALLRLDPGLDVLLSAVPTCFVPSPSRRRAGRVARQAVAAVGPAAAAVAAAGHGSRGGARTAAAIGRLAEGLGPDDAVLLFPEGGNFTPRRRARVLHRLRARGAVREAAYAARARHVLPPMTAGPLAALASAPRADAVFVAHTGLDVLASPGALWRGLPLRHPVRVRWWRVPAAEIPAGEEARSAWLLTQWADVDAWVTEHQPNPD